MFSLNESLNYYLYPYYINMGCGIEILSELVRNTKTGNPLSGDVYLFCGKKRDMIKLLRWQEDGFILYQKRLEDGTFELPRFNPREDWNKIEWKTFMMIMSGISLNSVKYRKRLRL